MAVIGGGIKEIAVKHPTLGSFTFFPVQSAEAEFDPGGYRNNSDKTAMDGGGNRIYQKTLTGFGFSVDIAWDMNTRDDMGKVQQLMASTEEAEYTTSHVNGSVYRGTGMPVGDLSGNAMTATIPLTIEGSGEMEKIA